MRVSSLALAVALAGCGTTSPVDPDPPDAGADPVPPPDAWVDQAGPLFAPDHILDVDVELPAADWDVLRDQTRTIPALFSNCGTGPFADPFTYFKATVTVDGHRIEDVGLRKKGFLGSMDSTRPSLKIKFDEFADNPRWYGLKGLTLNNAKQDASVIRTCMSYQVFAAAGIPAPRCNFAHVTVNGADLGVYVHVEAITKDFLRGHFADPEGNLYEGTLSDFRAGWTATFELKTNETANDRSDLDALTAALEVPDAELLARLAPLVDVDAFIRFWAAEILVTHWDGFTSDTNNFFAYHDPTTGQFQFLPWGPDMSFMPTGSPFNLFSPMSVQAQALLARRLYLLPETRDRYVAAMRALLAEVWDEPALIAEVDRMEALIAPIAGRDLTADIEQVRGVIRGRRAQIEAELAPAPPVWTTPLRNPMCLVPAGTMSGNFTTTWGTDGSLFPFAVGDGTMTATLDGQALAITDVGATSGAGLIGVPPPAQITLIAKLADGTHEVVALSVTDPATYFAAGTDVALDWNHASGIVYHSVAWQLPTLVGIVADGTLHLTAATTASGGAVRGSFTAEIKKLGM